MAIMALRGLNGEKLKQKKKLTDELKYFCDDSKAHCNFACDNSKVAFYTGCLSLFCPPCPPSSSFKTKGWGGVINNITPLTLHLWKYILHWFWMPFKQKYVCLFSEKTQILYNILTVRNVIVS